LGSTLALSNAAGAVAISYAYEAFGKTTITGTSFNPFQYTGRENDGTGLYYYRARYYSPMHQRFTSEDPLYSPLMASKPMPLCARQLQGTTDLYVYTINSPVRYADPLGLDPQPTTCKLDEACYEDCKNAFLLRAVVECTEDCITDIRKLRTFPLCVAACVAIRYPTIIVACRLSCIRCN